MQAALHGGAAICRPSITFRCARTATVLLRGLAAVGVVSDDTSNSATRRDEIFTAEATGSLIGIFASEELPIAVDRIAAVPSNENPVMAYPCVVTVARERFWQPDLHCSLDISRTPNSENSPTVATNVRRASSPGSLAGAKARIIDLPDKSSLRRKNIPLPLFRNQCFDPRVPLPPGGAFGQSPQTLERDAMDAIDLARRAMSSRTSEAARSRSPDAGIKSADISSAGDGGYQARHSGGTPGRAWNKP